MARVPLLLQTNFTSPRLCNSILKRRRLQSLRTRVCSALWKSYVFPFLAECLFNYKFPPFVRFILSIEELLKRYVPTDFFSSLLSFILVHTRYVYTAGFLWCTRFNFPNLAWLNAFVWFLAFWQCQVFNIELKKNLKFHHAKFGKRAHSPA